MKCKTKLKLLGLSVLAFAYFESKNYAKDIKEISIKGKLKNPIKILHISDIHSHNTNKKLNKFVHELDQLKPDLIIATGDFLGSKKGFETIKTTLKPLLKYKGVFVFGANDYYNKNYPNCPISYFFSKELELLETNMPTNELKTFLVENGWKDVNNKNITLKINGNNVFITGLNDPHVQLDKLPKTKDTQSDLKIGVVHAPYKKALKDLAFNDLIFAGHTHGGQISLPNKPLVTNTDLEPKFASGLFKLSEITKTKTDSYVNISSGLGNSRFFPFRLFAKPSATILTIL
jgi:predicted MPP superfamily phosphohydrolase